MHPSKRIWLLVLLMVLTLACPVQAQSGSRILLQSPEISKFPIVSLTFEAYNSSGHFLSDLTQNEIQVTENDTPVTIDSWVRLQPGLHIILAFNAAQPMAAVGGAGSSRFDLVKKTLLDWIRTQPADSPDELSLVTNSGLQATRLTNPALWTNALEAYTPDLNKAQASLGSLITALDLAGDPTRRVTSKRAILYVTGPLPDANLAALPNLADRAVQLGVRISTWLVLPAPGETPSGAALANLAAKTGGEFFSFTGSERLPDPELNFQSLRYLYRLTYTSVIRQSGTQRVLLSIKRSAPTQGSQNLHTSGDPKVVNDFYVPVEQHYTLNLLAPNSFFLSPPTLIERTWTHPDAPNKPALLPAEIELQAIVEYPDGLHRPLTTCRLFVDGKQVYEMTTEPFNPLVWSLANIRSSGRHTLQVVVVDSFGLTHSSIEIPVDVNVESAPLASLDLLVAEAGPYLPYAGGVAVAGLVLAAGAIWIRRNHTRWAQLLASARAARSGATQKAGNRAWVTGTRLRSIVPVPAQPRPFTSLDAPARLARIVTGETQLTGDFKALSQTVIRLGSDPHQADYVIDSEAIDGLHSRILRTPDGRFTISDAGSITGTWVNYVQTLPSGTTLEHGDLIQMGREQFRFELMDPPPPRCPRVTLYRDEV